MLTRPPPPRSRLRSHLHPRPNQVSHHPQSSPIVQSLEMYNGMFSSDAEQKEEADSAARAAGVEPSELHIEACAICCDDIILGPHSAVLKMKIPEVCCRLEGGRGVGRRAPSPGSVPRSSGAV